MTVAELIELLKGMPQELPVAVPMDNGGWAEAEVADVMAEPNETYPEEFEYDDVRGVPSRGPHVRIV